MYRKVNAHGTMKPDTMHIIDRCLKDVVVNAVDDRVLDLISLCNIIPFIIITMNATQVKNINLHC